MFLPGLFPNDRRRRTVEAYSSWIFVFEVGCGLEAALRLSVPVMGQQDRRYLGRSTSIVKVVAISPVKVPPPARKKVSTPCRCTMKL